MYEDEPLVQSDPLLYVSLRTMCRREMVACSRRFGGPVVGGGWWPWWRVEELNNVGVFPRPPDEKINKRRVKSEKMMEKK